MAEEISNKDLKEAFDLLDFNKEGVVDIADAVQSLKTLEYDKNFPVLFKFMEEIGEGKLTYDEFEKKIGVLLSDVHDDNGLRRMFELFINDKSKNVIDIEALKRICSELGESFTEKDTEFIMKEVGDGNAITLKKNFNNISYERLFIQYVVHLG